MIQAKELMIGDWVLFHDMGWMSDGTEWHEDRICRVIGIGDCPRLEWTEDGDREEWPHASYGEIDPIPLTEEILERNGFKYHAPELGMYGVMTASYYDCEGSPHVWCDGDPFSVWFEDEVMIRYVHELQHVLRLCGLEKDIKL